MLFTVNWKIIPLTAVLLPPAVLYLFSVNEDDSRCRRRRIVNSFSFHSSLIVMVNCNAKSFPFPSSSLLLLFIHCNNNGISNISINQSKSCNRVYSC